MRTHEYEYVVYENLRTRKKTWFVTHAKIKKEKIRNPNQKKKKKQNNFTFVLNFAKTFLNLVLVVPKI